MSDIERSFTHVGGGGKGLLLALVPQGDEPIENVGRRRGDGRAALGVAKGKEIATLCVGDGDADLGAHESSTGVVPDAVLVAVEISVEAAVGDEAEIEGSGAVGAELPPPRLFGRWPRDTDHAFVEIARRWFLKGEPVLPSTLSANGGVLGVGRSELGNHRDPWSVAVDATERDGMPRIATAGVCAAVDGVDNDDELLAEFGRLRSIESVGPGLFAEDSPTKFAQSRDDCVIHENIGGVLTLLRSGERPVPCGRNGELCNIRHVSQRVQNGLVR